VKEEEMSMTLASRFDRIFRDCVTPAQIAAEASILLNILGPEDVDAVLHYARSIVRARNIEIANSRYDNQFTVDMVERFDAALAPLAQWIGHYGAGGRFLNPIVKLHVHRASLINTRRNENGPS
jgi:hypothetical protein